MFYGFLGPPRSLTSRSLAGRHNVGDVKKAILVLEVDAFLEGSPSYGVHRRPVHQKLRCEKFLLDRMRVCRSREIKRNPTLDRRQTLGSVLHYVCTPSKLIRRLVPALRSGDSLGRRPGRRDFAHPSLMELVVPRTSFRRLGTSQTSPACGFATGRSETTGKGP